MTTTATQRRSSASNAARLSNAHRRADGLTVIPGGAAPVSSTQAGEAPAKDGQYTVKRGDNMTHIARDHGISLSALRQANPQVRDINRIYPGQQLTIPGVAANGASHASRGRSDTPPSAPVVNGGLSAATIQARIASDVQPTLRRGASGPAVEDLQKRLVALGRDPGPVDGKFGPRTAAAVRAFQRTQRIGVDGIVGPQTWGKLANPVADPSPATAPVSASGMHRGVPAELAAYGNGRIPASALSPIGVGSHRLWGPAADAFKRMRADASAAGIEIGVTDSYRSYAAQVDVARRKGLYRDGGLAAVPGTSRHGWGLATDLRLDRNAQTWMQNNAQRYGFSTIPREPWHWQYGG